ncbi:hypothetical protein NE237_000387 [Protea cynaroides]|uniref:Pectinesterase n=1 Tax=Protea cynaroides TaxID=273540 RepID=A0A9Q0KRB7_9MAGN|nr:hypothetical protein NE237_000387 [Protea cynaroides]
MNMLGIFLGRPCNLSPNMLLPAGPWWSKERTFRMNVWRGGAQWLSELGVAILFPTTTQSSGPKHTSAVAAFIYGDNASCSIHAVSLVCKTHCGINKVGFTYFEQCYIQGAVDFIFGRGQSIYEDCSNLSNSATEEAVQHGAVVDSSDFASADRAKGSTLYGFRGGSDGIIK